MTTDLAAAESRAATAEGRTYRRRRHPARAAVRSGLKHAAVIALSLTMIYPLIWLVLASLKPEELIFRDASLALADLSLDNYRLGWNALTHPFSKYLLNTVILVGGSILGNLISCSLAAYAFARLQFTWKRVLFAIMLMTIMLPFHVVVVPQYIIFAQLGWVNSFLPLVVPKFLAIDAFFVFLMVQFIRSLPKELDEAARIDGAGHFRIYRSVILPLMVPALATTAIFTFIWTWNDFFSQLIYLTSNENFTVSLALRNFLDASSTSNWGGMFAMSVVSLIPLFVIFLLGQRYLLQGIATTGIK